MLTLICLIFMIGIFGRLIGFAFQMAWGLTKILLTFVFLPVIILGCIFTGLFAVAIPILAIVGLVTLVASFA